MFCSKWKGGNNALKAELSDEGADEFDDWKVELAPLKAELDARDERRCGTCRWCRDRRGCALLTLAAASLCISGGFVKWEVKDE